MTDEPAPISYAAPGLPRRPPIDLAGTVRQLVFAFGVGLLTLSVALWLSRDGRDDSSPVPAGVGAMLVATTLPWPGRIGRRREPT